MTSTLPPAICIMGPTASGKTDLAIYLRQHLPVELISVDSAMVYRGLDIGSAKPSVAELQIAPHRLVDIVDPVNVYSAARFREDALNEMKQITQAGSVPLLVGGTMLYFKALLHGLSDLPDADEQTRENLEREAEQLGWPAMHERLASIDPVAAKRIHPNDPQRIQRALEVYEITGKPLTELQQQQQSEPLPYQVLKLALVPSDRALLHKRIAERFDKMLEAGLIDEVNALQQRGDLHPDLPAIRAVGYRQVWDFLDGKVDYPEMREKAVVATRQLAKRQFTWLRSEPDLEIYDPVCETMQQIQESVLKKVKLHLSCN